MANVRTLQRSFGGGELSPEMYGRIDDAKYQSGAATMRNFIAKPQGPAENRPGFSFVSEVKDSSKQTRLIPFTFNTTQTMVIETGAGYFRFHTQGGTLQAGSYSAYKSSTVTITIASPGVVTWSNHGLVNTDRVAFTTTGALPTGITANTAYYVLKIDDNSFRISTSQNGTPINTTGSQSGTHAAHKVYSVADCVRVSDVNYYCITETLGYAPPNATYWYPMGGTAYEVPNPYAEADLFDIHHVQSADVLTLVHPNYPPKELRRLGSTTWTLINVPFTPSVSAPSGVTAVASGHTTAKYDYKYVVTTLAEDQVSESAASSVATANGNLLETGGIVTISWSAVTGAFRYNVYKLQGGIYGYIGQTASTSIIDDNINPDMSTSPPNYDTVFDGANKYPGAVSYFEQRRVFAGTNNDPQTIWMTRSGTESNMSYSLPTRDDDRIKFRVAAREANTIRHIVPLTQLLLLTSSAEWRVTSVNSDAITPSTISVRPQSYVGSNNVQPVIINNTMIYGAARGGHVRECGYSWQANGFVTGDMSIRAAHLFDNLDILDMAYSKAPTPIIWMVSSSGKLLGLTYVPEQSIGAWHQHDTDGTFESCTVVAEGKEDVLYVVVKRTVDGSSVRYIERMESRQYDDQARAFFVDSGATYDGTNMSATTMTVSGGTTWGSSETLTLTASASKFVYPGTSDVGDAVVIDDGNGNKYRFQILETTSAITANVRVDRTVPVSLRNTATTEWSFARNTISGLTWLEGETVNILADGAVHPQRVVTDGAITLDRSSSIVTIGLPITADLQTLPVAMQIDSGFGQGRMKNVNKAWLRVFQSSGIFIGPDENNLTEAKQRTTEPYGTPPALKSKEILVMTTPSWADSGQVFIRQTDPLPLSVVALTLEISVGA